MGNATLDSLPRDSLPYDCWPREYLPHIDPEFPLQMWNVLDRDSAGSTRTTNALEAYHHSFNATISCQHPTIWRTSKHSQRTWEAAPSAQVLQETTGPRTWLTPTLEQMPTDNWEELRIIIWGRCYRSIKIYIRSWDFATLIAWFYIHLWCWYTVVY